MRMIITEMEFLNIRKFPSLKLRFTDAQNQLYKNSFIMMGNGTGKTTTITLIKALLDGTAENWSSEYVLSFKPLSGTAMEGIFSLSVRFDGKTYKYNLELDYTNGKASIFCSTSTHGGRGRLTYPPSLRGLFTENFVHRFIFNGEQAQKALDTKSNEAEDAIKYLYRLDVLDKILQTNRRILEDIQDAEGGAAGTEQSVKNLRTRKEKIDATIIRLQNNIINLNSDIEEKEIAKCQIDAQISKIDKKFEELNKEKTEALTHQEQLRIKKDLEINKVLAGIKSPYLLSPTICQRMYDFGSNMTKLKLPKTISKDFFKELSEETHCICGRIIGSKEKDAILINSEQYLGSDQQSVLNSIKSSLLNSTFEDSLQESFMNLDQLIVEDQTIYGNLLDIEDRLAKAGGEEAVSLRLKRDSLIAEIGALNGERKAIESRDESNLSLNEDNNLYQANKASKDLDIKIAAATRTNDALRRKNIIEELINQIRCEATKQLKTEIIQKTNSKLRKVITDDVIEIDSIEQYIQLKGKTGASDGQTLSIAYCFLGTMFEDAELQFPFVIDSPAGKMDNVKRRAVANILPTLFNQLIAFVTSAEVEQFSDRFYNMESTQFVTIIAPYGQDSVEIHLGKDYFDTYQRDHKEEEE